MAAASGNNHPVFRLAAGTPSAVCVFSVTQNASSLVSVADKSSQQLPLFTVSPPAVSSEPGAVSDISWSPDGRLLAAATPRAIYISDTLGSVVELVEPPRPNVQIRACAFGWRTQRYLYFGGSDGSAYVWDRKEGRASPVVAASQKQPQTVSPVSCLALPGDDGKLAVGFASGAVTVRSLKHATTVNLSSPFKESVFQMAFYPFKKSILAAAGDGGTVALWDLSHRSEPHAVKNNVHTAPIHGLAFPPCNKNFYCTVGLDGVLRFHDVQQTSSISILPPFEAKIPLLSVSINDDHNVAIGTSQGTIFLYDIRKRAVVQTMDSLTKKDVTRLRFQPPKWAMDEALKEVPIIPKMSLPAALPALPRDGPKPALADQDLMGMFSPVSKGAAKLAKSRSQDMFKSLAASKMAAQSAVKASEPKNENRNDANLQPSDSSQAHTSTPAATNPNIFDASQSATLPVAQSPFATPAQAAVLTSKKATREHMHESGFLKTNKELADVFHKSAKDADLNTSRSGVTAGDMYALAAKTPTPALSQLRRDATTAHATKSSMDATESRSAIQTNVANQSNADASEAKASSDDAREFAVSGLREAWSDTQTAETAIKTSIRSSIAAAGAQRALDAAEIKTSPVQPYVDAIRERVSKMKNANDQHASASSTLTATTATHRSSNVGSGKSGAFSTSAVNRPGGLVSFQESPEVGSNNLVASQRAATLSAEPQAGHVSVSAETIRAIVEDCLQEHRSQLRMDIQNMHLDLLRQFEIQKMEIGDIVRQAVEQASGGSSEDLRQNGFQQKQASTATIVPMPQIFISQGARKQRL